MGNICSFLKKNKDLNDNNPLLKNNIQCSYCKGTFLFNEYHKHLIICKKENINKYAFGDF